MPPKTAGPRRTATPKASPGRFSRPAAGTPQTRFPARSAAKPQPRFQVRPATRTKSKAKAGGLGGMLSGALSALPSRTATKPSKGTAAKAAPAVGLLAAGVGAVLGRRQLQKRKQDEQVSPVSVSPYPPASPVEAVGPAVPATDTHAPRPINGETPPGI